jgi:hypothetical protein
MQSDACLCSTCSSAIRQNRIDWRGRWARPGAAQVHKRWMPGTCGRPYAAGRGIYVGWISPTCPPQRARSTPAQRASTALLNPSPQAQSELPGHIPERDQVFHPASPVPRLLLQLPCRRLSRLLALIDQPAGKLPPDRPAAPSSPPGAAAPHVRQAPSERSKSPVGMPHIVRGGPPMSRVSPGNPFQPCIYRENGEDQEAVEGNTLK